MPVSDEAKKLVGDWVMAVYEESDEFGLTLPCAGRDFRLTDVEGILVPGILVPGILVPGILA
jgi:hypothetical protein